jgi:hypothetical protein
VAEDFRDADDREIFRIDNCVTARSPHSLPAHAEEFKLRGLCGDSRPRLSSGAKLRSPRDSPPESLYELGSIHFPRSFAG